MPHGRLARTILEVALGSRRCEDCPDRRHGKLRNRPGPYGSRLAGYEVVIGSRDAARAQAAAAEFGCRGLDQRGCGAGPPTWSCWTTKADGAVETARSLRDAIGETPVLSVSRRALFTKERRRAHRRSDLDRPAHPGRPSTDPLSPGPLARRRRTSGAPRRPTRTRSSAATMPNAKAARARVAAKLTSEHAIDAGPLASARALEGMTAVI